ncbi:MAG: Zinc carboxypeptidase, partial [Gemmatimonadetes bacterium]|nr:Zinc carboxypeptidase [Gemmatimonadota bacterium]
MRSSSARRLALALLLVHALPAVAQRTGAAEPPRDDARFSFYDRGPYRSAVPRPDALLGYQLGDMNTQYAAQERVLLGIAGAASDRVRVEEFTTTYERRTMRNYIVSSPENIGRLDAIRADLDRLADPRGVPQAELDAIAARTPAVVWISGSVHGNESPGFETCIQLLYQLAASDEPATLAALRNAIVIINPSSNPDGHERFSVWYNSVNVAAPDPQAQEHREPWSIQGRYNHYRFDMNRDLIASTQREVQGIMRQMLRWHPMVAADLHGHVTSYFFPPAARPVNANIGADAEKWLDILGRGNAQAFDRYGWMYYTRDVFDLYYPGYYDTWPSLNGAIGMTFETDGGGHRGLLWRRPDGTLVSFRDGIAKHYVASMATIETTARRSTDRVRDYLRFRQAAVADGRTGTMRRILLAPGRDPGRAAELVSALVRAGIEVRRATAGFSTSAHAYYDDATAVRRFEPGTYVVDLAQPQGRVAKAILEPTHELDPAFARAQVERFRRNQRRGKAASEGYEFYDITAWSLPVAFGVEAWWSGDASPVAGDLLTLPGEEPALPGAGQRPRRVGGELLAVDVGGGITAGR